MLHFVLKTSVHVPALQGNKMRQIILHLQYHYHCYLPSPKLFMKLSVMSTIIASFSRKISVCYIVAITSSVFFFRTLCPCTSFCILQPLYGIIQIQSSYLIRFKANSLGFKPHVYSGSQITVYVLQTVCPYDVLSPRGEFFQLTRKIYIFSYLVCISLLLCYIYSSMFLR
jgi:hypothetical protein